jgi:hypothetical protein
MPRKKTEGAVMMGGKKRGRRSNVSKISTADLLREVERRRAATSQLAAHRQRLAADIAAIDAELASLGAATPAMPAMPAAPAAPAAKPGKGKRGRKKGKSKHAAGHAKQAGIGRPGLRAGNTMSLADALHQLLTGKTMSVTDATANVQSTGYKTDSPNLRTMVNQQLLSNKSRFKRVSRGQYTAI